MYHFFIKCYLIIFTTEYRKLAEIQTLIIAVLIYLLALAIDI